MLGDDAPADAQAEARAGVAARREERLAEAGEHLGSHPGAPRRRRSSWTGASSSEDDDAPAERRGLRRVAHQVNDDLGELAAVEAGQRAGAQVVDHLARADVAVVAQDAERLLDDGADVGGLGLERQRTPFPAAHEVLDLADHRRQALLRRDDDVGQLADLAARAGARLDGLGIADQGELVADLMGQPGHHAADGGERASGDELVLARAAGARRSGGRGRRWPRGACAPGRGAPARSGSCAEQVIEIPRFLDVLVDRDLVDRLDRALLVSVAGEQAHEDGVGGPPGARREAELKSIDPRHLEVGDDEVGRVLGQGDEGGGAGLKDVDVVVGLQPQGGSQAVSDQRVVVNKVDSGHLEQQISALGVHSFAKLSKTLDSEARK